MFAPRSQKCRLLTAREQRILVDEFIVAANASELLPGYGTINYRVHGVSGGRVKIWEEAKNQCACSATSPSLHYALAGYGCR